MYTTIPKSRKFSKIKGNVKSSSILLRESRKNLSDGESIRGLLQMSQRANLSSLGYPSQLKMNSNQLDSNHCRIHILRVKLQGAMVKLLSKINCKILLNKLKNRSNLQVQRMLSQLIKKMKMRIIYLLWYRISRKKQSRLKLLMI